MEKGVNYENILNENAEKFTWFVGNANEADGDMLEKFFRLKKGFSSHDSLVERFKDDFRISVALGSSLNTIFFVSAALINWRFS